ncbi:AraC family transcriptional regulator [Rhodoplanes sp. TEM]|uniref:AraC family transcriptional regulator n=1 Tax=Rhodoplanes tepidamans TaxID=200616 RepID=A0ABT5JEZ3_RHOTP|nr:MULTISPECIES: AraC family transcriptional regulator [Rhodoplanes]MDC7788187.1 AraC family transcriptional regulator [Rhodoplanes tepidamans]MDC7987716.1 AraC family transcriptional regulator [Rhodoplanes sp. TEM]MDQ0354229.1 AraC family transcriptional regulator [Rhodoplanes tepidamans]
MHSSVLYCSPGLCVVELSCSCCTGPFRAPPLECFTLCLAGRGRIVQRSAAQNLSGFVEPGSVTITPANSHGTGEWPRACGFGIGVAPDFVREVMSAACAYGESDASRLASRPHRSALLREGLLAVRREVLRGTLCEARARQLLASGLLDLVLAGQETPVPDSAATALTPARLRRVSDYIEANLSKDLKITELAETVGLSRSHFTRAFRAATGMTPHRFLQKQRIAKATHLLETSEESITEIAFSLGFSNPSIFASTFRAHTGMNPTAWRRHTQ